ncbi:MAG: endonuclease/exonuclease/phosphatase family protein [Muribaculaceae bacterium]
MKTLKTVLFAFLLLASAQVAKSEVFMSYNVKGSQYDSSTKQSNLETIIGSINPDVVAVQEVWSSGKIDDAAASLGYKYEFLAVKTSLLSNYGIALMYKETPIRITTKTFETHSTNELEDPARGIIIAEFSDYVFMCTHMGLESSDRMEMANWIAEYTQKSSKAVFVAGDLNETITGGAIDYLFGNGFYMLNSPSTYSYPSDEPTKTIDMILAYNRNIGKMLQFSFSNATQVDFSTLGITASDVSDHLPVVATITRRDDQNQYSIQSDIELQ